MSIPSPLQPQDPLSGASTPKSRMRVTVLTILALHVVFIGGLLMQGCDKKPGASGSPNPSSASGLPSLGDTNWFSSPPPENQAAAGVGGGIDSGGGRSGTSTIPPVGSTSGSGLTGGNSRTSPGTGGDTVVGFGTGSNPDSTSGAASLSGAPTSSAGGGGSPGSGGGLPIATSPLEPITGSGTEHVIKKDDRIGDLAKKYGVTAQAIIDANPTVKPRNLKVGDRLAIPSPKPAVASSEAASSSGTSAASASSVPGGGEIYVVKQGDNLTKIGKRFGVSAKALRAANSLKNDRLVPKQRLIIPARTATTAAASPSR